MESVMKDKVAEDTEKGSTHNATTSETTLDPVAAKSFKRKADFILLPILTIAYLLNSLDRSNLANAHTVGITTDLGMVGNQYNQVLTYYQIPFIVFGPLMTLFTNWFGARLNMGVALFIFGSASFATAWAKNFQQLVVCRCFVGAAESGFLASVIYYLSIWYTRKELASRIGIFYAALVGSSAFGGLLAYGMFRIQGGSMFTWSYLFILEGSLTMLWALPVLSLLPSSTQTAWFLTPAEKAVAKLRLELDSVHNLESKFNWVEALSEFRTPHAYIRIVISFISGTILTSNANFLAMIVARLGFSTVKTNLRGFHAAAANVVSLVGYILLATIETSNTSVLYFAIFLCTIGAYPSTPIGSAWLISNIPNLNARVLTTGLYISFGNCAGLLSSNIYIASEAPRYITDLRVNLTMCVLAIAICSVYSTWMRWENRKRDRAQGITAGHDINATEGVTSARDPNFRFQP
ncbi:MFS general substrate transporter [Thozetella sp. PMI_491]|nr:MFS general substrate transporter [Thozetella sp. PMI_491]